MENAKLNETGVQIKKKITIQEYIDSVPYAVISVFGMRGSGKSYLSSRLKFEKVNKIIYVDVVGAFRKERPDLDYIEIDFLPSKDQLSSILNKFISINQKEIILDISYLTREEMINIMDWLSDYLIKKNEKVALVIDEAGEFLEQEKAFYSHGLERLIRIGRNKGVLYVVLITQRLQKVNKHAIALSDAYVAFKLLHKLDLQTFRDILGVTSEEFKNIAKALKEFNVGSYILTDGINVYVHKRKE